MKKAFKKLSTISLFVLIALLPSCDPVFYDTFKIKNELGRDIKATDLHGHDTITIKNGEVKIALENGGLGTSQFSYTNTDRYLQEYPVIIFDNSVAYTSKNTELIKQFEKSIFKMSCWEILFFEDRKMSDNCEVLYTITEEDYQNAIILNEMNK